MKSTKFLTFMMWLKTDLTWNSSLLRSSVGKPGTTFTLSVQLHVLVECYRFEPNSKIASDKRHYCLCQAPVLDARRKWYHVRYQVEAEELLDLYLPLLRQVLFCFKSYSPSYLDRIFVATHVVCISLSPIRIVQTCA